MPPYLKPFLIEPQTAPYFLIRVPLTNLYKMVDKTEILDKIKTYAEVAELADALRSGRSEPWAHEGSNPSFGTAPLRIPMGGFVIKMVQLMHVEAWIIETNAKPIL